MSDAETAEKIRNDWWACMEKAAAARGMPYYEDLPGMPGPVERPEDAEKEFTYRGVAITRYNYETLPSPMAACKLGDGTMQEIAQDIHGELLARGWTQADIDKYLAPDAGTRGPDGGKEAE